MNLLKQMCAVAVVALGPISTTTLLAQSFPLQMEGRITKLWADKTDVVLELDVTGPCGSVYYRVLRSAENFQEIYLMLTAAASGRKVQLELSQCSGTNTIVSHGAAIF